MVIKSLSRQSPSFSQLLHYMAGEGRVAGMAIRHNLGGSVQNLEAVNRAFMANAKHCPKRKGGVVLYHEILSLSPEDRDQASPEMLADLAEHYLALRASEALVYGVVHFDAHPHVHLMISANQRGRAKKIRCSRRGFAQIKRSLEAYQRVKYPQLSHSLIFDKKGKKQEVKEKERLRVEGATSVKKRTTATRREELSDLVLETLCRAQSRQEWQQSLQKKQIKAYRRGGRFTGVVSNGKKYRFRTLAVDEAFKVASDRWRCLALRQGYLQEITLQKLWRQWREFGFAGEMLAVLGGGRAKINRQNSLLHLLQTKREMIDNQQSHDVMSR